MDIAACAGQIFLLDVLHFLQACVALHPISFGKEQLDAARHKSYYDGVPVRYKSDWTVFDKDAPS